ncbi:MAG: tetratricopeptide repeat protein [Pseudomonadota bacterium]|nr:tetratricopeptide repeat protein [Pseudomonadota bacterium]
MSRANSVKFTLPLLALLSTAACATSASTPALSAEEQVYQDAIQRALEPATAEQKAQAERSDPITRANFWANEYQKDATNLEVTVSFMRALRQISSHDKVIELATTSIPIHPNSHELYLELGRTYLAQNKLSEAAQILARSADFAPQTEAAPLAVLGLTFDRMAEHRKAQEAYEIALTREPDRITTLSNYGLSLALTGQLDAAEEVLRKAVNLPGSDVRVRQNLALILGLQGRFEDMMSVDPSAPMQSVEANQRVLREMMGATGSFNNLKRLDQVIDEVERTPAAAQAMPGVPEAQVTSEAMADPVTGTDVQELEGAAGQPAQTGLLRPKLRGSQDS